MVKTGDFPYLEWAESIFSSRIDRAGGGGTLGVADVGHAVFLSGGFGDRG